MKTYEYCFHKLWYNSKLYKSVSNTCTRSYVVYRLVKSGFVPIERSKMSHIYNEVVPIESSKILHISNEDVPIERY